MKFLIGLILAFLIVPFTMGASLIDQDTKRKVEELDYKIEKLLQYGHANHGEHMRTAKEQNDLIRRLADRVEALELREREVVTSPTPTAAPTPEPVPAKPLPESPAPMSAATTPTAPQQTPSPTTVTTPPVPVEAIPAASMEAIPATTPPAVVATKPEEAKPTAKIAPAPKTESPLPYIISVLSVLLMIGLFLRMKRSEQRIKTMLWRADMEALREDLARERKQNPKVHLTGEPNKVHLP